MTTGTLLTFTLHTPVEEATKVMASVRFRYVEVQVGLRNMRVSDRMADSSSPAVVGSMSTSFSRYIW